VTTYSKRCLINLNALTSHDFPFINFCKMASMGFLPTLDITKVDANGYSTSNGTISGFTIRLPSSSETTGPYVLTWTGTGTLSMGTGTWTDVSLGAGTTRFGNGVWGGTNGRVVSNLTDWVLPGGAGAEFGITITATDPSATGDYVRDVKFYFLADEADLTAGKVARQP